MTTITCEVQYVHFAWNERLEEGPLNLEQAIKRFRSFPFEEQLIEASELSDPTFPTVAFRAANGDSLAIWCALPRAYDALADVHGGRWSVRVNDESEVERLISAFFRGEWSEAIALFSHVESDVEGDSLASHDHTVAGGERIWIIGGSLLIGLLSLSFLLALLFAGFAPYVREGAVARFGDRAGLAGGFFALAAVALGYQWIRAWAGDYMYYGPSERIYVDQSRTLFALVAAAHALMVIVLGTLAVVIVAG